MSIAIAVSAQGYGAEKAFDYRAEMTGHTVIKPSSGQEFLEMLAEFSQNQGPIYLVKIFSHSYPRGIIMSNWSGFYDEPGANDTKKAAYVSDLTARIQKGDIRFSGGSQILLFGCNLAGNFSIKLSQATAGTVIASSGGTYPEIAGGRETGIFISTDRWEVYTAGNYSRSAGKRLRAW